MLRLLLLAAVLVASSCSGSPAKSGPTNIVLVSLDTLRADRLGCHGNPRNPSPAIDTLCAEGVSFDRAIANSPWTIPSHATLLTGQFPRSHGVKGADKALRDDLQGLKKSEVAAKVGTQLAERAKAAGVSKVAFDRGYYKFHGRVKALADAAREAGLEF